MTIAPLEPRVSVVVATRDRPQALDQCLGALQASEHDSFEVIVVDQSTDDASARVVADLADARVRYLPQQTAGPRERATPASQSRAAQSSLSRTTTAPSLRSGCDRSRRPAPVLDRPA